jgi:hypothetical protein
MLRAGAAVPELEVILLRYRDDERTVAIYLRACRHYATSLPNSSDRRHQSSSGIQYGDFRLVESHDFSRKLRERMLPR